MSGSTSLASDYTQLAFHGLAHLRISGPARLHTAEYVEWSREHLAEPARLPLERDASVLSTLYEQTTGAGLLQSIPELHGSIAELRASAARGLDELFEAEVRAPKLLRALCEAELPVVELFRAAIALAAPAFEAGWRGWLRARCEEGLTLLEAPLDEARALSPALADARVELAWPLGSRGRAFAERIVVGVPGDWSGLRAERAAVVALHEASVHAHAGLHLGLDDTERYVRSEWAALVDVAETVSDASAPLREAHASWLAALDLSSLGRAAARRGLCAEDDAQRIVSDRDRRAEHLAAAGRRSHHR